jgi:hypothetical protein
VTETTFDSWRDLFSRIFGTRTHESPDREQVFRFRCPSRSAELPFLVDVAARWQMGPVQWPEAVVHARIHQHLSVVVRQVSGNYSVLDAEEAQSQVNLVLSHARRIADISVELAVAEATLIAEPDVLLTAREQEQVVRDSVVDAARHENEMNRMRLLRDSVLLDGGMARLWWLNGDRGRLQELVKLGDLFENAARLLTAGPADADLGPGFGDVAADLIGKFLVGLDPHHRLHLLTQLSGVFHGYERSDLAGEADAALRGLQER